ncbi:MAG: hypothetical protein WAL47_17925 [Pyrinomonadaceae bacterium]
MKNLTVCLLLVLATSMGANATDYVSTNAATIPFTGACDGVTDDGPAIQAAFENITAAGGSHRLSLPDHGVCKVSTAVNKTFNNTHDIIIQGNGSGTTLLLATGNANAFTLGAAYSISWFNVTFQGTQRDVGDPNYVLRDATIGLRFGAILQLLFENCQFYGIFAPDGMIRTDSTFLIFTKNKVRGSTTSTGGLFGVITMHKWIGAVLRGNTFLDYGDLNGVYHSKTPLSATLAWILTNNPSNEINREVIGPQPSGSDAYAQGTLVVADNFFDEGALRAVHVQSNVGLGEPWTARVHIARNNTNASAISSAFGYYLQNVRDAFIDQVYVGYVYARNVPGLYLNNVQHTTVKGSFFLQLANSILTRGVGELRLENSTYATLDTDGNTTLRLLQEGKRINRKPAAGIHSYSDLTAIASNVETVYGAPVPTAAELVPTGNVFRVVGSGIITEMRTMGIEPGTQFTLIFGEGMPQVSSGATLKIGNSFTAQPEDTLSLVYVDGAFYERARKTKAAVRKFF